MIEYYKTKKGYYYIKYNNNKKKRISFNIYNKNQKGGTIKYKKNQKGGNIKFSDNIDRFEISIKTLRDNNYIEIIDNLLNNRYLASRKRKYICIYDKDDTLYIIDNNINIVNDYIIFDRVKNIIDSNKSLSSTGLNNFFTKNVNDITFIYLKNNLGCFNTDLDIIQNKLDELNLLLKNKCPNLELKLDNYYNLSGKISSFSEIDSLILCLYYNNDCISSIIFEYKGNNAIVIDSITNILFEGKKYNKLLRSIIIIVANLLICNKENIYKILSVAINPISAWLLISNFDTNLIFYNEEEFKDFLIQEKLKNEHISDKDLIFLAYENIPNFSLRIEIEINKINIDKAEKLFLSLIKSGEDTIICP
jgi:hypothetical protein